MASRFWKLEEFVEGMERWGLTDVMLPFLLIFVIVFAVLQKTNVLGDDKRNLNTIVAIVFGLLVVIPHVTHSYPAGFDAVDILNQALPSVSILIVGVVFLLILMGIFFQDKVMLGQAFPGWVTIISILAIIAIFGGAAGWWTNGLNSWLEDFFGADALAIFIMLLVFGVIISFVTGNDKAEEATLLNRVGIDLGKLTGGKKN